MKKIFYSIIAFIAVINADAATCAGTSSMGCESQGTEISSVNFRLEDSQWGNIEIYTKDEGRFRYYFNNTGKSLEFAKFITSILLTARTTGGKVRFHVESGTYNGSWRPFRDIRFLGN